MSVKDMISRLESLGFSVKARQRKDGGYIITSINGQKFTGAKGNTYARSLLGEELSQARQEQLSFNVNKYIQGAKKKATLDDEMKKELRKVQRLWRKRKVKARITAKKVKEHIAEEGREAAFRYLQRQTRYGEGYAYEENVEYLAEYVENVALGISDKEYKEATKKVADFIRSKMSLFKEEWIAKVYGYWYEVIRNNYDGNIVAKAIMSTYALIG